MNEILYRGGFKDNLAKQRPAGHAPRHHPRSGPLQVPRGRRPAAWRSLPLVDPENSEQSSFDHFGNSYAANIFMTSSTAGGYMYSNSPYLRPTTRVPTPARTLYYEENIGRWAWAARRDVCDFLNGIDPGPTKTIRWLARRRLDLQPCRSSTPTASTRRSSTAVRRTCWAIYEHYRIEKLSTVSREPGADWTQFRCIIVRGDGLGEGHVCPRRVDLHAPLAARRQLPSILRGLRRAVGLKIRD